MNYISGNAQLAPAFGCRKNMVSIPFRFTSDGSDPVLPIFDYPFVEFEGSGTSTITLRFDWDIPDDTVIVAKSTGTPVTFVVANNEVTIDFDTVAADDYYEFVVFMSKDGALYNFEGNSLDLYTGTAPYEDLCSPAYTAKDENRLPLTIFGSFETLGGGLAEFIASRGFYVEDQGSGVYRVVVGMFDNQKASCIVSTSHGAAAVTYSGDDGYFEIDLGSSPVNSIVSFMFNTVD